MAPLYDKIYQHIISMIQNGKLKPGDRVPSEKELTIEFQVSRITSKKALELLAANNIIDRVQGKGSFVSNGVTNHTILEHAMKEPTLNKTFQKWKVVGVIIPDFADSYGVELLQGIEEKCSDIGARVLLKISYDHAEEEEEAIRSFLQLNVDGFIIFPVHGEHYSPELLRLVADQKPLVFVDRYLKGLPACSVFSDNRKAAYDITKRLIEQGHKNIGFISPPTLNTSTLEDRLLGYKEALTHSEYGINDKYLMTYLYSSVPRSFEEDHVEQDGIRIEKFVKMNPEVTAFVVVEYNLARILRKVLIKMGKAIPTDCSIVCFDSPKNPLGDHLFTHVKQNEYEMGQTAVELLQAQWNNESIDYEIIIPHVIVQGEST